MNQYNRIRKSPAWFSQCPLEFKVALWLGWHTAVGEAWRDFYWLTPIICFAENEL